MGVCWSSACGGGRGDDLRVIGADFWSALAVLLAAAAPPRLLAHMLAVYVVATARHSHAGEFWLEAAQTAPIALAAGLCFALALLIEALVAHRAFWERHDPTAETVRSFE